MSFSADKVPHLRGQPSQRRFSTSKEASENGMLLDFLQPRGPTLGISEMFGTKNVECFGEYTFAISYNAYFYISFRRYLQQQLIASRTRLIRPPSVPPITRRPQAARRSRRHPRIHRCCLDLRTSLQTRFPRTSRRVGKLGTGRA
jgi:hypothetical protein